MLGEFRMLKWKEKLLRSEERRGLWVYQLKSTKLKITVTPRLKRGVEAEMGREGKHEPLCHSALSVHTSQDTFPVSPCLPLHSTPTTLNYLVPSEIDFVLGPRRNSTSTATATTWALWTCSFHRAEVLFAPYPDTNFCATDHPLFGNRIFQNTHLGCGSNVSRRAARAGVWRSCAYTAPDRRARTGPCHGLWVGRRGSEAAPLLNLIPHFVHDVS